MKRIPFVEAAVNAIIKRGKKGAGIEKFKQASIEDFEGVLFDRVNEALPQTLADENPQYRTPARILEGLDNEYRDLEAQTAYRRELGG